MLKEKLEYAVIKLNSGEEVLGKVVEDTDTHIILSRPRTLVMRQTPQGTEMGIAPLVQLADPNKNITFNKAALAVMPMPMLPESIADYKNATSPVLQPDNSVII